MGDVIFNLLCESGPVGSFIVCYCFVGVGGICVGSVYVDGCKYG